VPRTATKRTPTRKAAGDEAQNLTAADLMKMVNSRKGWEGTVVLGNDPSLEIKRIPTGLFALDQMLGGGFARNRHCECFGHPGVGKTSVVYSAIANAQRMFPDELCAFLDIEGTYDARHARAHGVNTKKLVLHRQKSGNRAVDFMELLTRTENFSIIAMDSIAALVPLAELDNDNEQGSYGTEQAKLMSKALRKLTAANKQTALVWINQQRENIGGGVFGKKFVTSGGKAMAFYAGIRLEFVRTENIKVKGRGINPSSGVDIKDQQRIVGHRLLIRLEKDKTGGGAFQGDQTTLVYDYRLGRFDEIEDLMYLGRVTGLVKKSGSSWWIEGYEDEKQNGRPAFKKWLRRNRIVADELRDDIEERISAKVETDEAESDEDE
jgi:recombination protein RecA